MNGTRTRRNAAVERYVHDLAIALASLPADEREDVIAGVREHIDEALAATPDYGDDDVLRVLTSLGDPAEIAADAQGRSTARPVTQSPLPAGETASLRSASGVMGAGPASPLLERSWIPVATMGVFGVAGLIAFITPGVSFLAFVLWLLGLAVLVVSPLWRAGEKIVGAGWFGGLPILGVLATIALGLVPQISPYVLTTPGDALDSVWYRMWEVTVPGTLIVLAAALVVLAITASIMAWLIAVGTRRARRSSRVVDLGA